MLKKMIVKNFKCYKEETVFDFEKTRYNSLEKNVINNILRGALFIGDNASGKTTALEAIKFLIELLFGDESPFFLLYTCLFSKEQKTELTYIFQINKSEISYKIVFNRNGILEEILKKNGFEVLRRIETRVRTIIDAKDVIKKVTEKSVCYLKKLYFITKFDDDVDLHNFMKFIEKSIYINSYSKEISTYYSDLLINKFLELHGSTAINKFLNKINYPIYCKYVKNVDNLKKEPTYDVLIKRKDIDFDIDLFLELESTGNQTLINLLPSILTSVNKGGMLIIDEFSCGLHNKLEILLIKYILEKKSCSQLFFTSHSAGLISNSILRPDQIYIVEFIENVGSRVKRISDYSPRVFQNLQKMYLNGEFGGIPHYAI